MTASVSPRGLLFGTAAESYERFRLGYPDEVVERTMAHARRDVTRAVEVGAGTGKATRAFASHGVRVTALEPDPDMFAVLQRETAGMRVETVLTRFEEYDGPRTDLVYAAAAWHWTDPTTRWDRAADLLHEGGVLAVFGSPMRVADRQLQDAIADACPLLDDRAVFGDPSSEEREREDDALTATGRFADVERHQLAREVVVSDRDYVGYLSTLSAYLELTLEERQHLTQRVAEVVPAQVRLDLTISLLLARRV